MLRFTILAAYFHRRKEFQVGETGWRKDNKKMTEGRSRASKEASKENPKTLNPKRPEGRFTYGPSPVTMKI